MDANDKELDWSPLDNETAEQYCERVGGWPSSNMHVRGVLEKNFGIPEHQSKKILLQAQSFWMRFFRERFAEYAKKGRFRKSAVNFARRKVETSQCPHFSEDEILGIVESIDGWRD